ncbi:MAG: Hpt domain-containing protein [Candidatus Solibacter usitatus]|nr:Hpt domain-containing protein [Candidatus Solibacter usitatus]
MLDMAQLRNITMEDQDLMREIVGALVDDAARQIEALREAVERGSAPDCARLAHSARGACGNVGAASMAAIFTDVEYQAKNGDLSRCELQLHSLAVELDKLRTQAETI